jgi:hypothetical protein
VLLSADATASPSSVFFIAIPFPFSYLVINKFLTSAIKHQACQELNILYYQRSTPERPTAYKGLVKKTDKTGSAKSAVRGGIFMYVFDSTL